MLKQKFAKQRRKVLFNLPSLTHPKPEFSSTRFDGNTTYSRVYPIVTCIQNENIFATIYYSLHCITF